MVMESEERQSLQRQIAAAATRLLQSDDAEFKGFQDLLPFVSNEDNEVCPRFYLTAMVISRSVTRRAESKLAVAYQSLICRLPNLLYYLWQLYSAICFLATACG